MKTASRRHFLRGAVVGIAAVSAGPVLGKVLTSTACEDRVRLNAMIHNYAIIEGETFYLTDGLPLELHQVKNIAIHNCQFIWAEKSPPRFIDGRGCDSITITNCHFKNRTAAGGGIDGKYLG